MIILSTQGWKEYSLLDSGNSMRLEQFGPYILARPDPQCLWKQGLPLHEWGKADAVFSDEEKRGKWILGHFLPEQWKMHYRNIAFYIKLTPFKHTGLFPEQHLHWDWIQSKIKNALETFHFQQKKMRVLNLFGYTGLATLICSAAGAEVVHVDGSYPTIGWAKNNQELSNLQKNPVRWILDDCLKFVRREAKRGEQYDCIIMDPPVFGHGPKGEQWKFAESFPLLLAACKEVLSSQPTFILINTYAVSMSSLMLQNMLEDMMDSFGGKVVSGELALQEKSRKRLLSTGIFARWESS